MNKATLWAAAFVVLILSFFSVGTVISTSPGTATSTEDKMIGAYYYVWYGLNASVRNTAGNFNTNWEYATSTPFWGEYVSNDSSVADTQILLAKLHKIDFFAVSWLGVSDWYDHLAVDDFLQQGLLKAEHISTFKFCLFYESDIILNSTYDMHNHNSTEGMSAADYFENVVFLNDTNYAAEEYFNNPSYLRIDGKPVLFLYDLPNLCENLSSSTVHSMLVKLRSRLLNDIYLVADVEHGPLPADITGFQLSNFSDVLNATTNYFFSSPSEGWDGILNEAQQDYPIWRMNMTEEGMSFFPDAYPGYNDSKENSSAPVLSVNATAFDAFLQIALNNTDSGGITMITSWNEWKESTVIEPSAQMGDALLDVITDIIPEFPSTLLPPAILILAPSTLVVVCIERARQRRSKLHL